MQMARTALMTIHRLPLSYHFGCHLSEVSIIDHAGCRSGGGCTTSTSVRKRQLTDHRYKLLRMISGPVHPVILATFVLCAMTESGRIPGICLPVRRERGVARLNSDVLLLDCAEFTSTEVFEIQASRHSQRLFGIIVKSGMTGGALLGTTEQDSRLTSALRILNIISTADLLRPCPPL